MGRTIRRVSIPLILVLAWGCASLGRPSVKNDPFYKSFYEKARIIMSKWEKQAYKYLPNIAAKRKFIIDFWKKRDPTPETEDINEVRDEFYKRIAYANRWLSDGLIRNGWKTDRGRALVLLGFPDYRYLDKFRRKDSRSTKCSPTDTWHYVYLRITLVFVDEHETGDFRQANFPTNLLGAIKRSLAFWGLSDPATNSNMPKFKVTYKDGKIQILVPIKNLQFTEIGDNLKSSYSAVYAIYYKRKRVGVFKVDLSFVAPKAVLLKMKYVQFRISCQLKRDGKYTFEIILREDTTGQGYRLFLRHKNKVRGLGL